jgi:acetyl-CoA acetyltransferase
MRDGAVIVGIGETRVGKHPGRSTVGLQAEAVIRAIRDADIERSEVDGLYALGPYATGSSMHALGLVEYLGMRIPHAVSYDVGGTVTFMGMCLAATAAIEEGRIEVAVCTFGENAATRRAPQSHGFDRKMTMNGEEYELPFGAGSPLIWYGLMAQRYLDRYKLPQDAFFPIALALRKNASLNENAAYRELYDKAAYDKSPMMAEPLRRLDSSPVADGGGAFVICSKRFARERRLKHTPVSVLGVGMEATGSSILHMPDMDETGFEAAGREAFAEAGLSPEDVDLVTIHDGFSISIAMALETLGFCGPGETVELAARGGLAYDGERPVNTHGGLMSQGHVGGVLHVVEAVRQLRGDAGSRQIRDARIAAICGNGGPFAVCGMMLLGKGSC